MPRMESIPFLIKNEPFRFYILLNKDFSNLKTLGVKLSYKNEYLN